MTYREWFLTTCNRFGMTPGDVDLVLVNQAALIPSPSAAVDALVAKKALVKEFATIIPLSNVTEGGYSVSWNMDAIKLWYKAACAEVGVSDKTKPVIRNKSNLW